MGRDLESIIWDLVIALDDAYTTKEERVKLLHEFAAEIKRSAIGP